MKNNDYNAVNSIFFVSYILFVVPLNLALKMLGPGWYLPVVTIAFGITSIGTAYVHNFSQLAGVRFLLGIFEAGIMPGISYYVVSLVRALTCLVNKFVSYELTFHCRVKFLSHSVNCTSTAMLRHTNHPRH